ncbi:MAG: sugar transferase [Bacteroidales bacterium]|nr:sugar transferase [Bacteroidales bacterium]
MNSVQREREWENKKTEIARSSFSVSLLSSRTEILDSFFRGAASLERERSAENVRVYPVGGRIKRLLDVTIAFSTLILLFPLFLLTALLIKLIDGGPVIFAHSRIGYNARPFLCLKFRTMVRNSEETLRWHLAQSNEAAHEWATTRKLKRDPRVTALGSLLRSVSFDEFPQLINVLRGEMSIVGPRPIVAKEVEMYGNDAAHYFRARPGLTGPWQISGRSDVSYQTRVMLDRNYVENWSLWRDLLIIFRTFHVVALAKGSY